MTDRVLVLFLALGLLAAPLAADGQPATRGYRIGYLGSTPPTAPSPVWEAFLNELRERGYVEGQNLVIEPRYSEGKNERFAELAAELVRLKVDVIVSVFSPGVQAAQRATATIPIVMAGVGDPVAAGLLLPSRVQAGILPGSQAKRSISPPRCCRSSRRPCLTPLGLLT